MGAGVRGANHEGDGGSCSGVSQATPVTRRGWSSLFVSAHSRANWRLKLGITVSLYWPSPSPSWRAGKTVAVTSRGVGHGGRPGARRPADGPPPWVAAGGTPVAVVQGAWDGPRGLGADDVCPECRRLVPA